MVKKINQLKPDLIVITGDAIDKAENHYLLDEFLTLIDQAIPKVAILGNWEYWARIDIANLATIYSKHNGHLLINQNKQFNIRNKTMSITGIDDFIGGKPDFESAIMNHQQSDYHIVLNHCPAYSDSIAKKQGGNSKVDLILSGHTHGGQVNLFGFVLYKPWGSGKYLKGMYEQDNTHIYVSKGIGTTILPIRFGSRSEFAVFHLKA
jgi:predicted MPP superfamily phosphohydrolase